MSSYKIIKLTNLAPMHIGTGLENYENSSFDLHSDTLSSALASVKAQRGEIERLDEFLSSFSISSAFPFYEDMFFLPRPIGEINISILGEDMHNYRKDLKKIKYIELSIWNKLINGETIEIERSQLNGEIISPLRKHFTIIKPLTIERVSIDNGVASPFSFEWLYFNPKGGLYCIIDASKEVFKKVSSLFQDLALSGVGTDKNVGGGRFSVEEGEILLPKIEKANSTLLLSLYIPKDESEMLSLNLSKSQYSLLKRGGFISGSNVSEFRHLRKKSIYYLGVGSILSTTKIIEGKVVDLSPKWNQIHPVYRSGKPFSIQIKNSYE